MIIGLITKSNTAKDTVHDSEQKEKINLAYEDYFLGKYTDPEYTFSKALDKIFGENVVTLTESNGLFIISFLNGKTYKFNPSTKELQQFDAWIKNADGSFSKGNTTGIHVGDIVHYETELGRSANVVNSTRLNELKSDLATYSGSGPAAADISSIDRDDLTWEVLDVKDGKLRLISSVPTTKRIFLSSEDGYNNAVYLLDKACDILYSIDKVGKARNLKIEDIEKYLTYDYTKFNSFGEYGKTVEFTSQLQYPNIFPSEISCKGIDGTSGTDNNVGTLDSSSQTVPVKGSSTASNRLKILQTFWYKIPMLNSDFTDSKYYSIFVNCDPDLENYWLSSRSVAYEFDDAWYSIFNVAQNRIDNISLYESDRYLFSKWSIFSSNNIFRL